MNKQQIKIIKRTDGGAKKPPAAGKAANRRPKKRQRSVESTIKDWITERRENNDAEDRSSSLQRAAWNTNADVIPA